MRQDNAMVRVISGAAAARCARAAGDVGLRLAGPAGGGAVGYGQGADVRRIRHGGRLAVDHHPGGRGDRRTARSGRRLAAVRRRLARRLRAGDAARRAAASCPDEDRRPAPDDPRRVDPPGTGWSGSTRRSASTSTGSGTAGAVARQRFRPDAAAHALHAGDAVQRQRGAAGEHGEERGVAVGRRPVGGARAAVQARRGGCTARPPTCSAWSRKR